MAVVNETVPIASLLLPAFLFNCLLCFTFSIRLSFTPLYQAAIAADALHNNRFLRAVKGFAEHALKHNEEQTQASRKMAMNGRLERNVGAWLNNPKAVYGGKMPV